MVPEHTPGQDPLPDAIAEALRTSHRHLGVSKGRAMRYLADIAPFASIAENSEQAVRDLCDVMTAGEHLYVMGDRPPDVTGLHWNGIVACLQMLYPSDREIPGPDSRIPIVRLDCSNAEEMLELITVAFPGYFRIATCRMGNYYGVRQNGQLIAMGGERLIVGRYREISGLCTRPGHTGKGLATALLFRILRDQRASGAISWLHVGETNRHAIDLYHHLGFETLRRVELHRMAREG
ncbi:MAG TPA: GNAT family N-acetyltransferase [Acidobacteriaceae bacterium]|jgi:ribosomal protein S18 acetylase RimI-like enzyme